MPKPGRCTDDLYSPALLEKGLIPLSWGCDAFGMGGGGEGKGKLAVDS